VSVLAVALVWPLATGCDGPDTRTPPLDLLLITIDTARADRFSYVGPHGPGTPRVDALAGDGAGFVNAISPAPLTLPAHASLFTGRQPPSHAVRDNGTYRLPAAETTLAEILHGAGYATGAFVGAEVLNARYGLDQGFDVYDDAIADSGDSAFLYYAERSAEEVAAAWARWVDARGPGPLFAWVHLFDPHAPYRPPEPERSLHASPYDGEIAYADRVVGQIVDHWDARRGRGRSVVVVTSDHGEGLGEHGEATHGVLVHDATLRVPLVIRAPGCNRESPVTDPVHLIDLLPTVLTLLELPVPERVQGRDLGPLLRGETVPWSPVSGYAESLYARLHHGTAALRALREDGFKLVRGAVTELYDLTDDPGELRDVSSEEPQRSARMARELEGLVADLDRQEPDRVAIDEDARRSLESLGYVWSAPSGPAADDRDPREALASMSRMAAADRRFLDGDVEGAIAGYRALLELEPGSVDARVRLSRMLIAAGRPEQARDLLAEAVAIAPQEPVLYYLLGRALERLGRWEEALAAYDAGRISHPDSRDLRDGRWSCLNRLRRWPEMLAEAERAVAEDPEDAKARLARAVACCSQPLDAYVAALERELAALPGDPLLQAALAQARGEGGSPPPP